MDTGKYIIKKRFRGGHSKFVYLLEEKDSGHLLIKKRYNKNEESIFKNEIKHLKTLRDLCFTPKLLKVKNDTLTIYMTYCGEPINDDDYAAHCRIIEEYKQILKGRGVYHNDLKKDNICILNGNIYFIDFGWASNKKIKPSRRIQSII
jgi:predicted Ser/Thr protein kinase